MVKHVKTTNQWWSTTEFSNILWLQSPPKITPVQSIAGDLHSPQANLGVLQRGKIWATCESEGALCGFRWGFSDREQRLDVFSYFTYLLVLISVISKISIHII
jgi:hypothetical protein